MLLLKKEVKKVFQDCKMIAVVQNNASNAEDMLTLRHRLHKHSLTVKFFPNQVDFPPRLKVHLCRWLRGEKHPYESASQYQAHLIRQSFKEYG